MIRYTTFPGPAAPAPQDDAVFVDVAPELPAIKPDGELVVVEIFGEDTLAADDVIRVLARVSGDLAVWGKPRSSGLLHGGDRWRARMGATST